MTGPGRIEDAFARIKAEGRTGFIGFVTTGYPTIEATSEIVPALVEGGADIVELGVPFSDPLAEGPTIQRSSFKALENGVTPAVCLDVLRELRSRGLEAPVVLMGYYNPILAYGLEAFCRDAQEAGADGFIVVDLPPEESEEFQNECEKNNLRVIYLLAPTSPPERIARVAELGSGFVYCVSVTGVTGVRDELPAELADFVGRVRASTDLPIAVGFGISQHKHFQSVGRIADAAIVGSAIIDTIDGGNPSEAAARVKQYAEVVTGRRGRTA
jgi:tryptophan synthase alpha subunit